MTITGLGPHGEHAAAPEHVLLLPDDKTRARAAALRVAIILHTTESDWARHLIAGLISTLGEFGVAAIDVVDCHFMPHIQIEALNRLIREMPDAIISLPVANAAVASAHARVSAAGIKLILLDNVPTGLLPGKNYVSLVSADNFGLGKLAAEGLAPHLPTGANIGLLGYKSDFFATNEREIAFVKWMRIHRADLNLQVARFPSPSDAAQIARDLLDKTPDLAGFFVAWDTPAIAVAEMLIETERMLPISTVDLGRKATINLSAGGPIVAIAAQQPYRQGQTASMTTVSALLNLTTPIWVALPGLAVTPKNVVECFQEIWQMPAPREVLKQKKLVG